MNIVILGYGVEGKSVENYFKHDPALFEHTSIDILDHFEKAELLFKDFSSYDLIFRTPSIPPKFINAPKEKITSCTKYFFHHCPCPIIGVTGTKGKGTTCTMTRDLIQAIFDETLDRKRTVLVGNIGIPALDELPSLTKNDVVIYELSSFQLWDMDTSPAVAVVLRLEPDHLDVHESFAEYLSAKQNLVNFQSKNDFCIYFKDNQDTVSLAANSPAQKLAYPCSDADWSAWQSSAKNTPLRTKIDQLLDHLQVPGAHNREDAEAALLAAFAFFKRADKDLTLEDFLNAHELAIKTALKNFKALPHHIELVRELNGIKYYDDSFSTVSPALRACLNAFPDTPFVLIAGGKDKGFDLTDVKRLIFDHHNLIKAVLIGETATKLKDGEDPEKYIDCGTDFELAIKTAQTLAEQRLNQEEANSDTCLVDKKPQITPPVVLLSPCASSFDMFKSYKDRGDQFKTIVNSL
ncbi:UDP-N-acetylmuramoyl-L-alanine--D-glutamate ligase [Candidatus Saccharibacteria bacterium]|nr:UDP-N-acetylmuramoyl-L-alanine--D-glutamate ligase [Candidatus Saccharibacteria bacterium]